MRFCERLLLDPRLTARGLDDLRATRALRLAGRLVRILRCELLERPLFAAMFSCLVIKYPGCGLHVHVFE